MRHDHAPLTTAPAAEDGEAGRAEAAAEGAAEAAHVGVPLRRDPLVARDERRRAARATTEDEDAEEITVTTTTTQSAAEREHRPYDIEILAPGTFAGVTVTEADLQHVADNFAKLKGLHDVPVAVRLGHDDRQVLDQDDGSPSFGWAERVYKKGSGAAARLMATIVGMPRALRQAINAQAYRKVSASLYPAWQSTEAERNLRTGIKGKVLQHIAFLGTSIPRIRQLADLPRVLAAGERADEEAVLLCLSDPPAEGLRAAAERAADDEPTKHAEPALTLGERVRRAERNLKLLERGRKACEVVMSTYDTPRRFTSFDAAASPNKVSTLGQLFLEELDAEIERQGLDRDDAAVRARVARELLASWKSRPPSASAPDAPSLADQLDGEDYQRAISGAAPSRVDTNVPQRFSAPYEAAGYVKDKGVMMAHENTETPPLYGSRAMRADELGGVGNYNRLMAIARERKLHLGRSADRQQAEGILFRELGAAGDAMRFAETGGGSPPQYGTKGIAVPTDDARALCMREAANEELKRIPIDEPGRVGIAWRRAAARHAQFVPDYSPWNTRQRRGRG